MEESVRLQSAALMDEIDGGEERREDEGLGGEWTICGLSCGSRGGRGGPPRGGARSVGVQRPCMAGS